MRIASLSELKMLGLMETLSDGFRARFLALDATLLEELARALKKGRVLCSGASATGWSDLEELFCCVKQETELQVLVDGLQSVVRVVQKLKQLKWVTDEGGYTTTTLVWFVLALMLARIGEVTSGAVEKTKSGQGDLVGSMLKELTKMERCDYDEGSLNVKSTVKCLALRLISISETKHNKALVQLLKRQEITLLELPPATDQGVKPSRGGNRVMEFCTHLLQQVSHSDAANFLSLILENCARSEEWHRVFVQVSEPVPTVGILLFEAFLNTCHGSSRTRLALEALRPLLPKLDVFEHSTLEMLLCIASTDKESNTRLLAWKILSQVTTILAPNARLLVLRAAISSLFTETSKLVCSSCLKVVVSEAVNETPSKVFGGPNRAWTRDLVEFILSQIAENGESFPSSWISEVHRLFTSRSLQISVLKVVQAFSVADSVGKEMIATLYQAHLVVKTARATYDFINSDVGNLPHQLIPEFELFMEALLRANSPRLPRLPPDAVTDRIEFIFNTALSTLSCNVEKNAAGTGLLLCCATLGVVDKSSPSVKSLVNFAIQRVCGQSEVLHSLDPTSGVVVTLSLRCLQRCIIHRASDDVFCIIENHIQSTSASLLLSTVFQRETVKLLYRLRHPQEMIYTSLVEAQEFAFSSDQNLRSFVSVLGIVAAENAKFIAAQTSSDSHGYDDEILEDIDAEDKEEDYLKDFKNALARRNRIKHANEELISQGLMSAYLPLVDNSLQKSRDIRLQVAAILTLGEFMKLSPKTTNEHFGRVLQHASDTGIPKSVRIACIDVWASLQPLLTPSETKDNGVMVIYTIIGTSIQEKQDTCEVSCHALKKLLFLILHGQVRDDHLVSICVFLPSAGDDRKVIVESFFQQYLRRCTPSKVSRLFFDIYFSLVSAQDDTRDASLSVLTELINLAKEGSIKLEMLQTTLVSEIESKPRRVDSLRLLSQFPVIPAAALSKLTELVQRGVVGDDELEARSILIHLMSGQLQRCKDTLAKKKIQLAIQKLKASDATPRLHVDAQIDAQSIGKFLSDFQFE